jgi:hypothetical protein
MMTKLRPTRSASRLSCKTEAAQATRESASELSGGAGLANRCNTPLSLSFVQSTSDSGGLRNDSFWSSFSAATTARASLSDFTISTSLRTSASPWKGSGRSDLSWAKRVSVSSRSMLVVVVYCGGVVMRKRTPSMMPIAAHSATILERRRAIASRCSISMKLSLSSEARFGLPLSGNAFWFMISRTLRAASAGSSPVSAAWRNCESSTLS